MEHSAGGVRDTVGFFYVVFFNSLFQLFLNYMKHMINKHTMYTTYI
jgi:hypothetical protein